VAILPGDVVALNRKVEDLEEKLKKSDETIMSLEREKAAIQLELDEVRRTLEDRNTALIEALYRVQEMQGRLLTAADDDRQRGFFGRIFGRKRNNI
jgi:chromosome segregation ATPase